MCFIDVSSRFLTETRLAVVVDLAVLDADETNDGIVLGINAKMGAFQRQ